MLASTKDRLAARILTCFTEFIAGGPAAIRVILKSVFEPEAQRFLPAPWCRCPQCGTERVKISGRRDHIDDLSHRPLSILQFLLGGQLYHCLGCRLQFYDLRPRRSLRKTGSAPEPAR